MLLENRKDRNLDRFTGYDTQATDDNLAEALELLYQVMNRSYQTSGAALEVDVHGQRQTVQNLFWDCKGLLDKINQAPEKTGFLAMSVIEQTWGIARALVLAPVADMLDGDMSMLENARKLERILANNEYKQVWADKSNAYAAILARIGFQADPETFRNLTRIMDPLLDALTFYTKNRHGMQAKIYRIRSGAQSKDKSPAIARAICRYRSEKELVDAVMSSDHECLMAFGAIEKIHAQVKDYFSEWFNGYPEERQRNFMRNDNLTSEQYLAMPCDYTRAVYLCVKSGNACWLVHMPWKGETYSRIGDERSEYAYGKRASYAPYQIFYKDIAPAPEGSTMLAVPRTGYLLSELMDPMSMAWYPAFLDETMKLFFDKNKNTDIPCDDLVLSEETAAANPHDSQKARQFSVVPVYSGVPAVASWVYAIQEPGDIFANDENTRYLMEYFQISSKHIKGVPILPEKSCSPENMLTESDARLRKAYLKILTEKITDLNDTRWDVRRWTVERIRANAGSIIDMAGKGDLMSCMEITIDGTPILNPDGTPKMIQRRRPPWDNIPDTIKTSQDDARENSGSLFKTFSQMVIWASDHTSGRPPVVWRIRPKTAEDYAAMTGVDIEKLPELLRLSGPLTKFHDDHKNTLPSGMINKYTALGYGTEKRSAFIPCFAPLNICMNKKTFRTFDYFRN